MTDKQIADIIKDMVIMVDSREKKNQHILDYFMANGISFEVITMDTADYTFVLPNYEELGLDGQILVERKGSINEICGNFTSERERFQREFERIGDRTMHLVLEDVTWKKVMRGTYRSKFNPRSFVASILTFCIRYDVKAWFVGKDESPELIYNLLKYELVFNLKK